MVYLKKSNILALILMAWLLSAKQAIAVEKGVEKYGLRAGYIDRVEEDRESHELPIVMKPINPDANAVMLKDKIFTANLSKEFKSRYEDTFGRNQMEQLQTAREEQFTSEQQKAQQKSFGDFMIRRLSEHHVDQYFRSDPQMKAVWELKERVSNVNVEVSPGVRANLQYSLSGNIADLNVTNPWVGTRVHIEMDPSAFGPSSVNEMTVMLDKALSSTLSMAAHYLYRDAVVKWITSKALAYQLSCSFTASTYVADAGLSPRQHLGVLGLSYLF